MRMPQCEKINHCQCPVRAGHASMQIVARYNVSGNAPTARFQRQRSLAFQYGCNDQADRSEDGTPDSAVARPLPVWMWQGCYSPG